MEWISYLEEIENGKIIIWGTGRHIRKARRQRGKALSLFFRESSEFNSDFFSEYIDMAVMSYYAIRQELVTTKYKGKIDENGWTLWRIRLWYRTQSTSDIFKYLYTTKSYADSGWKTSNGNIPEAMVITCNDNLLSRATNMNKYQKPYGLFQTEYKKISFNSWKERICPFAIRGNNSVRIELTG